MTALIKSLYAENAKLAADARRFRRMNNWAKVVVDHTKVHDHMWAVTVPLPKGKQMTFRNAIDRHRTTTCTE